MSRAFDQGMILHSLSSTEPTESNRAEPSRTERTDQRDRCRNAARFSYHPPSDRHVLLGTREGSRHAVFVDARVDALGDRAHPRTQPRPAGTRRDRLPDAARSGGSRAPRLPGRLRADLGQPAAGLRRVGDRAGAARRPPGGARPVAERRSRRPALASHDRQPGHARPRLRDGRAPPLERGVSASRPAVRRCARQARHRQRHGGGHRRAGARAGGTPLRNRLRADQQARAHGGAARRTGALPRGARPRGDGGGSIPSDLLDRSLQHLAADARRGGDRRLHGAGQARRSDTSAPDAARGCHLAAAPRRHHSCSTTSRC